jgi:hypothetical protein
MSSIEIVLKNAMQKFETNGPRMIFLPQTLLEIPQYKT